MWRGLITELNSRLTPPNRLVKTIAFLFFKKKSLKKRNTKQENDKQAKKKDKKKHTNKQENKFKRYLWLEKSSFFSIL